MIKVKSFQNVGHGQGKKRKKKVTDRKILSQIINTHVKYESPIFNASKILTKVIFL